MAKSGSKKGNKGFWYRATHPKHKTRLFIIFNLIIAISTIIITIFDIIYGTANGQSKMIIQGWNYFIPFTINSNILMAIASIIALVKLYRNRRALKNNPDSFTYGRKFTNYYFMATVSLNLTAATVILYLVPFRLINGEDALGMVTKDMFFFHLVNPGLAVYSLAYLFKGASANQTTKLLCFIPPMLYSSVYTTHVLILHDWDDFYNYTYGGNYFLTTLTTFINVLAIYGIATLFANSYSDRLTSRPLPEIILPRMK